MIILLCLYPLEIYSKIVTDEIIYLISFKIICNGRVEEVGEGVNETRLAIS